MFDFSSIKESSTELLEANDNKLNLSEVLEHIDTGDYQWYDTLTEHELKQFQPYVVFRTVGALDDSVVVSFPSKVVEAVFGKWSDTGKKVLNELKEEFNSEGKGTCINISKYEKEKYNWRIGFSVKDKKSADALVSTMADFNINSYDIEMGLDSTTAKFHLSLLNDIVNVDFWEINKHPELVYQLLCSVSATVGGKKMKHSWLPSCSTIKNADKAVLNIIKQTQPESITAQMNADEYKILLNSYSEEEFDALLEDMGKTKSERKTLLKSFKSEIEKHGKKTKA